MPTNVAIGLAHKERTKASSPLPAAGGELALDAGSSLVSGDSGMQIGRAWFHESHLAQAPGLTQAEWAGPGPHHAGTRAGMRSFGFFQFAPYIMASRTLAHHRSRYESGDLISGATLCKSRSAAGAGRCTGDGSGSSSSMASCSSTTASTRPDQRRLSAAAPAFDPWKASSSSVAATTAGVPGSSPAMAPLLTSARMSPGSSARSTTSFDPAGSSALAPARSTRPGLSASAPAFYPTTASSSSAAVMPAVSGRLLPIARPTASSPDFPPEMLWLHPCGEQKIKGGRPDLLGPEFGLLAEQKRLVRINFDLKEKMHLRHNKEIENAFIRETRLAPGVEQDQLGDCKKAVRVQQDQAGKEEESHQCLRKQLQDVNGEQFVGVPKLGLPGAEENVACNNTAAHKEFSEFPGSEIKFGSINIRDIPLLQGRQTAVAQPNPEVDRRTSGVTPARASSPDQETDQEQNEKLL